MGLKSKTLNELFTQQEMFEIAILINRDKWDTLREYLRALEPRLTEKGIDPDYFLHWLQYVSTGRDVPWKK